MAPHSELVLHRGLTPPSPLHAAAVHNNATEPSALVRAEQSHSLQPSADTKSVISGGRVEFGPHEHDAIPPSATVAASRAGPAVEASNEDADEPLQPTAKSPLQTMTIGAVEDARHQVRFWFINMFNAR